MTDHHYFLMQCMLRDDPTMRRLLVDMINTFGTLDKQVRRLEKHAAREDAQYFRDLAAEAEEADELRQLDANNNAAVTNPDGVAAVTFEEHCAFHAEADRHLEPQDPQPETKDQDDVK
jgi:hypothetical protein